MSQKVELLGLNSYAGPSPNLWKNIPWEAIRRDPNLGVFQHLTAKDLGPSASTSGAAVTEANGPFSTFLSQGGAIANADASSVGSGVKCSSDGDNEGVVLRTFQCPFKLAYQGKPFVAEFRVKTDTIADTKHGIFVGLAEDFTPTAILPITAAGAIADKNVVGFHRLEGDGDYFDTVYKADGVTQVSVQTDAAAIVADTWVKLGIYFDGTKIYFFKDGVALSTSKTMPSGSGTDFPNDVTLGLIFSMLNATASSPGAAYFDWAMAAQLR